MSVRVKVPATSANLGPGFDTMGLALGLWDEVEASVTFGGTSVDRANPENLSVDISVDGMGARDVARDESHLVVRAMLACFAELERSAAHIELACHNRIPHGRGLGSSAAAIVAGVLAARELAGAAERFDDDAVLALAAGVEGHPDNVAPCLLGGLTIAWADRGGVVKAIRDDVHASVRPVLFVPEVSVKTDVARGLLPAQVPHADAVYNAGRAALLVEAMTRRPDLLFDATEERLHQSYRQPAMPGTIELLSALRHKGHAAVISGAGPSVLVLAGDTDLGSADVGDWNTLSLDIAAGGAHVAHE